MIYSKPVRELHTQFCREKNIQCSLSLFFNLKPFHVAPPTEREKLSCLCKICENIHLLLKGVKISRSAKISRRAKYKGF